ncbi:MAG TPA: outer membrane beta-barrel protein [Puia sp.]|nr:outer membrane beta-barrel protein [Puia sp.]
MKSSMNKLALQKLTGKLALSLLLLTATFVETQAQSSLQLGIKAGGDMMQIGGRSFDQKTYPGFVFGAYGQLNFSSKWSVQPELLWNQTVAKTTADFNNIYRGVSDQLVILNYAALPVMLVYKPLPELSVMVGPQYSYLVQQTQNLLPTEPGANAFSKSDLSIVFGGQLNLGKVIFGARYSASVNNISFRSTDSWRQYGFNAYIGYRIADLKLKKK